LPPQYFILRCGVRGPKRDSRNENVSHVCCCGSGGLRRADDCPCSICRHGGFVDYRDRGTPSPPERVQGLLGASSIALCQAAGAVVVRLGHNASARAPCRFTQKPDPGGHFPVTLPAVKPARRSDCGQAAPAHVPQRLAVEHVLVRAVASYRGRVATPMPLRAAQS
jgi:hypothetical protein